MRYKGGKNGAGVYQTIINQIPPHRVYIEGFLGSGAVMRHKRPAEAHIGIDLDAAACAAFSAVAEIITPAPVVINGDATAYLRSYRWVGDEVVYLDPPYLLESRSFKSETIYRHEFSDLQHLELLKLVKRLPCCVLISGYESRLYAEMLKDWRMLTYQATTHRGVATECLWMNYAEPLELHDYRYLGGDRRQRERIKRRRQRWVNRLKRMDSLERHSILSAIEEWRAASSPAVISGTAPPAE